MSIVDCITSFVDGRVRLRHPALKDRDTAELVCTVVGGVEGITSVQANPLTGSLLIYYDVEKLTREQLLELAEQGAAFIPGLNEEEAPSAETAEVADRSIKLIPEAVRPFPEAVSIPAKTGIKPVIRVVIPFIAEPQTDTKETIGESSIAAEARAKT